jgi:hypothetical protein
MENINLETSSILKSADDFTSFTAVIMQPDVDLQGDIASKEVIKKAKPASFMKKIVFVTKLLKSSTMH